MGTPYRDYIVDVLGTPYHWWRMDGNHPNFYENDLGDCPVGQQFNYGPGTNVNGVVLEYRQPGMLRRDDDAYCIECTGGGSTGQPALYASSSRLWFDDETRGSMSVFMQGTSNTSENYLFGTHPDNMSFIVYTTASGELVFVVNGASVSTTFLTSGVTLNDGQRHLVDITCDAVTKNKLYIDGAEVAWGHSFAGGGRGVSPWIGTVRANATSIINLALWNSQRYATASFNRPFIGSMDELQFWSETLTAEQVALKWALSSAITGGRRTARRRIAAEV